MGVVFGFIVFLFSFIFLSQFSDPPGINGYFYLKQIWSLSSSFSFYFKDYSLAFLPATLVAKITGGEMTAFRLCISAVLGAFAYLQWRFFELLLPSLPRWKRLGLTAVLVLFSFPLIELGVGFYKNMTAVALVLLTLFLLYREAEAPGWKWAWKPLLAAVLAFLCHKSATPLLLLIGLAFFIQRRRYRELLIFCAAGAVLIGVFALVFSRGAGYLNYLIESVGFNHKGFYSWNRELVADGNLIYLTLLQALVFFAAIFFRWRELAAGPRFLIVFAGLLTLATWLPIYTPGQDEFAYRMMLVYAAMLPALMFALLFAIPTLAMAAGVVIGIQICQFALSRPLYTLISNYDRFSGQITEVAKYVTPDDHLICHHGLEFYVDYKTGLRCQIYLSEKSEQKKFRMLYAPAAPQWLGIRIRMKDVALTEIGGTYLLVK